MSPHSGVKWELGGKGDYPRPFSLSTREKE